MIRSVVNTIEDIQEHTTNVVGVLEIDTGRILRGRIRASILALPGITTTPDGQGEDEKDTQAKTSTSGAAKGGRIQHVSKDERAKHLGEVVEAAVQGAGADVEPGAVDVVEVVGVEPVTGDEHGEEGDDVPVRDQNLAKALDFGPPGWVLHDNDLRTVLTTDVFGLNQEEAENETDEHENHEGDVGCVTNGSAFFDVQGLEQRNLWINHD